MGKNQGKKSDGWLCLPSELLKVAGWICIGAGILLIIIFVPLKYWMALIGIILILAGIWLIRS